MKAVSYRSYRCLCNALDRAIHLLTPSRRYIRIFHLYTSFSMCLSYRSFKFSLPTSWAIITLSHLLYVSARFEASLPHSRPLRILKIVSFSSGYVFLFVFYFALMPCASAQRFRGHHICMHIITRPGCISEICLEFLCILSHSSLFLFYDDS